MQLRLRVARAPAIDRQSTSVVMAATIFSALGIDPAGHYTDATTRRLPISTGRPIANVYAS